MHVPVSAKTFYLARPNACTPIVSATTRALPPSQPMLTCSVCVRDTLHAYTAAGVADGVGGWRSYGFDPGTFSRALMRNCARVVEAGEFETDQPAQILATAYHLMQQEAAADANR
jgi:hypothetical protein